MKKLLFLLLCLTCSVIHAEVNMGVSKDIWTLHKLALSLSHENRAEYSKLIAKLEQDHIYNLFETSEEGREAADRYWRTIQCCDLTLVYGSQVDTIIDSAEKFIFSKEGLSYLERSFSPDGLNTCLTVFEQFKENNGMRYLRVDRIDHFKAFNVMIEDVQMYHQSIAQAAKSITDLFIDAEPTP